jgi:hypothetical protein
MYIAFHPYLANHFILTFRSGFHLCRCAFISFSVSFVSLHLGVTPSIDGLPVQRVERLWGVGGLL